MYKTIDRKKLVNYSNQPQQNENVIPNIFISEGLKGSDFLKREKYSWIKSDEEKIDNLKEKLSKLETDLNDKKNQILKDEFVIKEGDKIRTTMEHYIFEKGKLNYEPKSHQHPELMKDRRILHGCDYLYGKIKKIHSDMLDVNLWKIEIEWDLNDDNLFYDKNHRIMKNMSYGELVFVKDFNEKYKVFKN